MNNWQELVVGILVAFSIGWCLSRIIKFVRHSGRGDNPCESCTGGCALRDEFLKKKEECKKNKGLEKKKKQR
ncbi:MAG: hypothetical protein WCR45_08860 [Bacteroidaceae bacterium]|nr:hypothetical protein [Bacteroidaceae bacterium]